MPVIEYEGPLPPATAASDDVLEPRPPAPEPETDAPPALVVANDAPGLPPDTVVDPNFDCPPLVLFLDDVAADPPAPTVIAVVRATDDDAEYDTPPPEPPPPLFQPAPPPPPTTRTAADVTPCGALQPPTAVMYERGKVTTAAPATVDASVVFTSTKVGEPAAALSRSETESPLALRLVVASAPDFWLYTVVPVPSLKS